LALADEPQTAPAPRAKDTPPPPRAKQDTPPNLPTPKGKGPLGRGSFLPKRPPTPKDAMSLTGLSPAKPNAEACVYRYPVGTSNPTCQAFVDQGLGMYYSYVWIEAARCFETALRHDPDCAYAWLMLNRSLEKWGRSGGQVTANPFVAGIGGFV